MSYTPGPGKVRPRYAGKVIRVTWEDAYHNQREHGVDDLTDDCEMKTYGVCTKESRKGVFVTMDETPNDWRNTTFIPWGMVKGVKVYATEWKAKK